MAVHNTLDLRRKARSSLAVPGRPASSEASAWRSGFASPTSSSWRASVTLVWSGFALTYPTPGGPPLVGWEAAWMFRGVLHRIAAVVMLAGFGFHAVHLVVDRRARACIRGMLPSRHDVTELRERLRWFVGRRADMPRSPALGYVEKLEYLALPGAR